MATSEHTSFIPAPPSSSRAEHHAHNNITTPNDASTSKLDGPQTTPTLGFISQASCYLHRYTRNDSDAHIVERADRLRSVFMGAAISHGRFTSTSPHKGKGREESNVSQDLSDLEKLLGGMNLAAPKEITEGWPFSILSTQRTLPLDSPAVRFAHGVEYCKKLSSYLADVRVRHANKESEVPEPLSQGDLYLCQESLQALEGALGACCEGVDQVCGSTCLPGARRFVSIRPPGHHCESENPMGFCWLNNVAVAAAHAHLEHGIDRVVIFDIDLHHGNGTQEIAWRLNALAHKAILERQKPTSPRKGSPKKSTIASDSAKPVFQVFYGSLHDVDSYPCEDMDPVLIANASVNISGGGGSQYVTNVHLEPYADPQDFHERLYPMYHERLTNSARRFLRKTKATPEKTLVIVSAGFDASEHEYASMSRHGAKVPTSFFSRFARDAVDFANKEAAGKLLAVLEGGYSQRALLSAAGSFLSGLVETDEVSREMIDAWFGTDNIAIYEKALVPPSTRVKKGTTSPRKVESMPDGEWRVPALAIYSKLVETLPAIPTLPAKVKDKLVTPPSSAVRITRSRYSSPAAAPAVKSIPESSLKPETKPVPKPPAHGLHNTEMVSFASTTALSSSKNLQRTTLLQAAPVSNGETSAFPPATPVIRFTFKAGERDVLPKPDFVAPGRYREQGTDESTSEAGDKSGSD